MAKLSANNRLLSFSGLIAHVRTPLYRNAYALMLSTVAASGLGLVYWMLAARFYDPTVVGINAAVVSVMLFLSNVAQCNLMSAMIRFIPRAGRSTGRLVGVAYLISVAMSFVVGGVFLLGTDIWAPSLGFLADDPWMAAWFVLGVFSWCIFALQDNVLTGLRQPLWVPVENILYSVVKIALLLALAAPLAAHGILASWTVPVLLTLVPINLLIFRRLIPQHVAATAAQAEPLVPREIVGFVAGNYLGGLFVAASTRLVPVIVVVLVGATATAYFYLPWTISTSIKLVVTNMAMSLTVEGAKDQAQLGAYARRFLLNTARLIVPGVVLVLLVGPYILRLSGGTYAHEGTAVLWLLVLSILPNMLNSLYVSIARVQKRAGVVACVQASSCLLGLGLSYFLLPVYGITGVGIAVLAGELAVASVVSVAGLLPIVRAARPRPAQVAP